jgi:hypothetical protein
MLFKGDLNNINNMVRRIFSISKEAKNDYKQNCFDNSQMSSNLVQKLEEHYKVSFYFNL